MNGTTAVTVIVLVIAVIVIVPFCVIWALNTLFGLSIGYGFDTWLAVIILGLFLKPSVEVNGK